MFIRIKVTEERDQPVLDRETIAQGQPVADFSLDKEF